MNKKRLLIESLFFVSFSCFILFAHSRLIQRINDDAYIHFRIAKHFVQFGQPYFNLNERVMSTSSTAWTLLLSLMFRLFGANPAPVSICNALLICGGAIFFANAFTFQVSRFKTALKFVFTLIYAGLMLIPSSDLMEISFCMFIVSAGLFLSLKNHPAGFSFLAMAIVIRYEMIVFFVLMIISVLLNQRKDRKISTIRIILFSFLGVFPFLTFQLVYYQTLIPQTVIAKSRVFDLALSYVFDTLVKGLMPIGLQMSLLYWEGFLTLLLFLFVVSIVMLFKRSQTLTKEISDPRFLFTISGVLIFALYLIFRVFLFEWYIPLFSVPILIGFTYLFLIHPVRMFQWIGAFLLTSLTVIVIIHLKNIVITPALQNSDFTHARVRAYLQLGRELFVKYPHRTLLTPEIGALGWEFDGKIIDSAGLVSPEALRYHPMRVPQERSNGAIGAVPTALVQELKPDLIVAYDVFTEAFRKSAERSAYTEITRPAFLPDDMQRFPDGIWGCRRLTLFIRK